MNVIFLLQIMARVAVPISMKNHLLKIFLLQIKGKVVNISTMNHDKAVNNINH